MNLQTKIEWEAWREICNELMSLGININEKDDLAEKIKKWGIEYAKLSKLFPNLLEQSDR